jgi:hypothetical protein
MTFIASTAGSWSGIETGLHPSAMNPVTTIAAAFPTGTVEIAHGDEL